MLAIQQTDTRNNRIIRRLQAYHHSRMALPEQRIATTITPPLQHNESMTV